MRINTDTVLVLSNGVMQHEPDYLKTGKRDIKMDLSTVLPFGCQLIDERRQCLTSRATGGNRLGRLAQCQLTCSAGTLLDCRSVRISVLTESLVVSPTVSG